MSTFNASLEIKSLVSNSIAKCAMDLAVRCVHECAMKYGFDADEALRMLCLEDITLNAEKAKKSTKPKADKTKVSAKVSGKATVPLPFIKEMVDFSLCNALAYNKGLFTQCTKKPVEGSVYCKKCNQDLGEVSGTPNCGTVQQRLDTGLYEFKDAKGRSPISYLKFLEKQKLTMDDALDEVEQIGHLIDDIHFRPIEVKKAPRGRPRKEKNEVKADNPTDLYKILEKPKKAKLSDEEKEANKLKLKKEREEKKHLAKEQADKEQEQDDKKKSSKKRATTPPLPESPKTKPVVEAPPKKTKINKVTYNGISYHQAPDFTLYELVPKGQESKPVGIWDPETKTIKPLEYNDSDEEDNASDDNSEVGTDEDN